MQSGVIRQKFLQYFEDRGHQRVASAPLVPAGDATLLFTNAGMVQFKDVFLGRDPRSYKRAVTVQKCMRAGGKHNDLDQVGRTARHLTFFEMLGNFSFGDYFKADAIRLAWGFLTGELGLDPQNLWVTVFESDDEAHGLWQTVAGVPAERIVRMGEKDNFWAMGETGPCGPSSEIFVDRGIEFACGPDCGLGRCECDRVQEIWNLVFMQYDRNEAGELIPLPRPSIDTGMGLERLAAYLQGVDSNFDTDLLAPLIDEVARLSGRAYDRGPDGMAFRVIADHVRAIVFLLAEGVLFSNEGRGYVLRRILRRAVRFGMALGFDGPFLWQLVPLVGQIMGDAYPEVRRGQAAIEEQVRQEEERFYVNLTAGMKVLNERLDRIEEGGRLSGAEAFVLYDTYGFPLDLTRDAAEERGLTVDIEEFEKEMAKQRERARASRGQAVRSLPEWGESRFVGYDRLEVSGVTVGPIYMGADRVERLDAGDSGWIWLPETPFYPEGGGQVGDAGWIIGPTGRAEVENVVRHQGGIWHWVTVGEGRVSTGDLVDLAVDRERRLGAMRNHTGTHLLHAALRTVLGAGVHQTGSLVAPGRLRFDFSHPRPLTAEEIQAVEELVNRWILDDRPVEVAHMNQSQAIAEGALAFFGDKYGEVVRVVSVPDASRELCGGTHCRRTGEIGMLAIVSETGVGAGSRRIEAVTGLNALSAYAQYRQIISDLQERLKVGQPDKIVSRVQELMGTVHDLEQRLAESGRLERRRVGRELAERAAVVDGMRVVVAEASADSADELREIMDGVKSRADGAVLVARHAGRVSLVVYLGRGLRERGLKANEMVRVLAPYIEGGGGGREEMAQAGGPSALRIAELLEHGLRLIEEKLAVAG